MFFSKNKQRHFLSSIATTLSHARLRTNIVNTQLDFLDNSLVYKTFANFSRLTYRT